MWGRIHASTTVRSVSRVVTEMSAFSRAASHSWRRYAPVVSRTGETYRPRRESPTRVAAICWASFRVR
jgi:hypothetical protein